MAHEGPTTVLIVEDDEDTADQLERSITAVARHRVIGREATLAAARERLRADPPDALLVDLGLPDGSGLDLIRMARDLDRNVHVMVISVFGDERHLVEALEAGATGYLLKDAEPKRVSEAIDQLLEGGSPLSPAVAAHLLRRLDRVGAASLSSSEVTANASAVGLTDREREVLSFLARGYTYAEIGTQLSVSVNTIRSHVKHIYRKLSVRNRSEAIYEARQQNLVES